MRGIKKLYVLSILVSLLALLGCDSKVVYEDYAEIPDYIWNVSEPVEFNVNITDSLMAHNILINIRHAGSYPYANVFVFMDATYPSGKVIRDTIECVLADESGKWHGDGLGDIWDYQMLFKQGVRFPETGTYNFRVEQAMRYGRVSGIENLPGIMDVGLRVERAR